MQHKYTEEQKKFLSDNVVGKSTIELTTLFNRQFELNLKPSLIKSYKANNKLNSGLDGRFKTGDVPPNKGKKGYCAPGCEKTWFKKGNKSHNWVPLGTERITKDGYIQIKITDGKKQYNYKSKHILIWEEHNGPVPKGHKIIFGDGDKRNFDITNLICVTDAQMVRLNQYHLIQKDADLTRSALVVVDLKNKISEKSKRR